MRIDSLTKRYFVVVVGFFLGVAAYFQATGIMLLVSAVLLPHTAPRALEAPRAPPPADTDHERSAAAILERNPFDSITGSLKSTEGVSGPATAQQGAAGDPLNDPRCDAARVLLISESEDASWSFAALALPGQKAILRRVGDDLAGRSVVAISDTRVWLSGNGKRCQVALGDPVTAPPAPVASAPPPGTPGALPADIAARIRKISDREYTVEKSAIEAIMSRQAELLGRVRIYPEKDGGLRVGGVRPGSLLGTIGIENGDKLQRINGFDLADPQAALEAYSKLQTASQLVVSLQRGGKPMDIALRIQ